MNQQPIISISGIRGRVGESLTWETAYYVTRLFYHLYLKKEFPLVVLGKDSRKSGEELIKGIMGAINKENLQCIYLGITTLPIMEWAVKHYQAGGGIMVTASHNPPEWNGIKFLSSWKSGGGLLPPHLMSEIKENWREINEKAEKNEVPPPVSGYLDKYHQEIWEEVKKVLDKLSGKKGLGESIFTAIPGRNYRVVVDGCSIEGGKILENFLKFSGIKEVILFNNHPVEKSERPLEPSPENLSQLKECIKRDRADLGFATDPDQDRLVAMPLISEEHTPLLTGKFLMELEKGNTAQPLRRIVINLSTSYAWEEISQEYGVTIDRVPVGEINVIRRMKEVNTFFGAEGNGGVILLPATEGRNSTVGMAMLLSYLLWSGKKLEKLGEELPPYYMIKEKLRMEKNRKANEILNNIKEKIISCKARDILKIDERDGLKIYFKDLSWIHLRPSNTEPIMRIFVEKRNAEPPEVKEIAEEIKNWL